MRSLGIYNRHTFIERYNRDDKDRVIGVSADDDFWNCLELLIHKKIFVQCLSWMALKGSSCLPIYYYLLADMQ